MLMKLLPALIAVFIFSFTLPVCTANCREIPDEVFKKIIESGDTTRLEQMIAQGYDINKPLLKKDKDNLKTWPLADAVEANSFPIVKCLLKHGADPNVENETDIAGSERPVTYAADKYNVTMLKLLVEAGARLSWSVEALGGGLFDGCLCSIIHNRDNVLLKYALEHGASPNSASCAGDSCIHPMAMAAKQKDMEALKLLVRHGGDLNYQDPYHMSTLLVAIQKNNLEMTRFILENGGDPNKVGNTGEDYTPMKALQFAKQLGNASIIAVLEKYGAN